MGLLPPSPPSNVDIGIPLGTSTVSHILPTLLTACFTLHCPADTHMPLARGHLNGQSNATSLAVNRQPQKENHFKVTPTPRQGEDNTYWSSCSPVSELGEYIYQTAATAHQRKHLRGQHRETHRLPHLWQMSCLTQFKSTAVPD